MWFKSAKEFKENMEGRMILLTGARFTTYSFKDMERAINHNERAAFVDAWLSEPPVAAVLKENKLKMVPLVYQVNSNVFN